MPTVLVVDDQPSVITFYESMFEEYEYELLTANSTQEALEHLEKNKASVDVILSDINMPDKNGYEFCKEVKSQEDYKDIPFIFVSGLVDLEEKIKGYAVDADDYITKPILIEEMLSKVNRVISIREAKLAENEISSQSKAVAHHAMTYANHLGKLLLFVTHGLKTNTYSQLSDNIFEFLQGMELNVLFQVHTDTETTIFSGRDSASPLEENIFELARHKGRFIDFGPRTIINYAEFSLLIKNMPIDDEEKYGMYKDILGNLCDIIEVKVDSLLAKETQNHKETILDSVSITLMNVLTAVESVQKKTLVALNEMSVDFDLTFQSLDLLEYQELNLKDIIESTIKKTTEGFEEFQDLSKSFEDHRRKISGLVKQISDEG